jgi:phosphopantetheinyl transferase (holo-ACP synthase)
MTSLTWSYNTTLDLVGCGVDCETADRFTELAEASLPMPFVFTKREIERARCHEDGALLLCLSFAGKEALFKAAGRPYDLAACEMLLDVDEEASVVEGELVLKRGLKQDLNGSRATFRGFLPAPPSREVTAIVHLYREVPS